MTIEDSEKTKEQLIAELERLRRLVSDLQHPGNIPKIVQTQGESVDSNLAQLSHKDIHYRQIIETLEEGIWIIDAEGKTDYVNPRMAQMLGYTVTEMLNRPFFDFMDDFAQIQARNYFERRKQGIQELHDFRFRCQDGSDLWAIVSAKPMINEFGEFIGAIAVVTDLTQRKQAEAALRESEERLRLALDAGQAGVWDWDIVNNKITWSERIYEFHGLVPGSFNGTVEDFSALIHPEDRERVSNAIQKAIVEKTPYQMELRAIWPNGVVRWLFTNGGVLYDDAGKPIRMLGATIDLTARKQAEAALKQSEARLRRIVDSNIIGIFFGELNGSITEANDAFLKMLGYSQEDIRKGRVSWNMLTPPEYLERSQQAVEELKATGICTPFEKEFFRKDGGRVWVQVAGALLERNNEQGFCYVIDLTEQKQAQAERDQLLEREQAARNRAEAASRLKDEFLAIVSHELRSPLNAILGWSRLLRMQKLDAQKAQQALESIERNAQAQTKLIEDLLDISRIIRGKINFIFRPINLTQVIEAALDTVRPTANNKHIQLQSSLLPIVMVSGDLDRLQQVVWNLLSNAIKFTPEGGRVEVMLKVLNSQVEIQVIDTGKGIKAEFLPYVFDRFRQENSAINRTQGGLGLGLSIVQNLVEMHGGVVDVTSAGEGKGSTFTVRLPLLTIQENQCNQDDRLSRLTIPSSPFSLKGLRVLLVEDEADTREFLVTALEQYEATVTFATSAREALQLLQQSVFDVLLSDIGMPEEDGYTFIRKVRSLSLEQGGQIPAAALTAYAREEDRIQALTAGFNMHVPKPIDPIRLVNVVAKLAGMT